MTSFSKFSKGAIKEEVMEIKEGKGVCVCAFFHLLLCTVFFLWVQLSTINSDLKIIKRNFQNYTVHTSCTILRSMMRVFCLPAIAGGTWNIFWAVCPCCTRSPVLTLRGSVAVCLTVWQWPIQITITVINYVFTNTNGNGEVALGTTQQGQ